MIPIKDNIQRFGTDPILEDQIMIYETKKSILDRPSGPVAQRIEAVSLFGSRWALSEDSGFKSYPSRPEVYLVTKTWCDRQQLWKAVITGDTVTRISIPIRGRGKITWRRPEIIWPKRSERRNNTKTKKNYQDEGEKSAINK